MKLKFAVKVMMKIKRPILKIRHDGNRILDEGYLKIFFDLLHKIFTKFCGFSG